jgi:hypothetical protein
VASFTAVVPTTRYNNYCQISTKNFIVARTENIVNKAGREKEIDYQTIKKTKEIKRDIEVALIQNTTLNAGAAATARQTEAWRAGSSRARSVRARVHSRLSRPTPPRLRVRRGRSPKHW